MTLEKLFRIAEKSEARAVEKVRAEPELALQVEAAGDYQEGRESPALVHAAHRGMTALVEAMLDAGADIECTGHGGGTALHFAAWTGNSETVRLLVERGAPVDHKCEAFGATPLGWAAHGFGPKGCFPKRDHVGAAAALLLAGADPELRNRAGNRPLDLVQEPADNPMRALFEKWPATV